MVENMHYGERMIERLEGRMMLSGSGSEQPTVSIVASSPTAWEAKRRAGRFVVQRSGGGDPGASFRVQYTVSGSATNGTDYRRVKGYVVFEANQTSITINVMPIADNIVEGDEKVELSLRAGKGYSLGSQSSATVTIKDAGRTNTDWPTAPFSGASIEGTIYLNQNGDAVLTGKAISPGGDFDGYEIGFDDPGGFDVRATGAVQTQAGFYDGPGLPARVENGNAGFSVQAPEDRRSLYLGVRAKTRGSTGSYGLTIDGPKPMSEVMQISAKNNAGSSGSDISGTWDYDFYSFKPSRSGKWLVKAIPDAAKKKGGSRLDAVLNVYDSAGKSRSGGFTKPVNAGGPGVTERWTGSLKAGATYYARVDGYGDSLGGYGVSVELTELAAAKVKAKSVAAAREDDAALTGPAVMPANGTSLFGKVTPIAGASVDENKTIILSLTGSDSHDVGSPRKAVLTTNGRGTK